MIKKLLIAGVLLYSQACFAAEQIADFSEKSLPALNEELRTTLKDTDTGTTAGKVIKLDSAAKIPAVDGSQVTNVDAADTNLFDGQNSAYYRNASNINAGTLGVSYGGTGVALVQRGRATVNDGDTITFPTSFGDTNYTLFVSVNATDDTNLWWNVGSRTATGFTIQMNTNSRELSWLAIDDV